MADPTFLITRYTTLSEVVNDIAGAVGLPVATDVVGSADKKVTQMIVAVNSAAIDLLDMYSWSQLSRDYSITIQADTSGQVEKSYPLPVDFYKFVSSTTNNKTTRLPAPPILARDWQTLKTLIPMTTLTTKWRIRDGEIAFLYPPSTPQEFTFEYQSCAWVQDADVLDLYKNRATKNGDTFLLDGYLIALLGRAKWLEMNKFDATGAYRDFKNQFDMRVGNQVGAPVLSIVAPNGVLAPLLSGANVPYTNFGNQ